MNRVNCKMVGGEMGEEEFRVKNPVLNEESTKARKHEKRKVYMNERGDIPIAYATFASTS